LVGHGVVIDVGFYHCTRAPVVDVAVRLAAKVLDNGERLLVLAKRPILEEVDRALWEQVPDSFLAHGMAGGDHDAAQPILLSEVSDPANGAGLLMLVERGVPASMDGFSRVLNLFADGSEGHRRARLDWKALADRDEVSRSYWQQKPGGGWEQRS